MGISPSYLFQSSQGPCHVPQDDRAKGPAMFLRMRRDYRAKGSAMFLRMRRDQQCQGP